MNFNKGYIYSYKTKNGQKRFFYQVENGRNEKGRITWIKKRGFRRKKDAEMAKTKLQSDLMNRKYFNRSNEKFKDFIIDWFENHNAKDLGGSQYLKKKMIIEKHLLVNTAFAHKKIDDITTRDIDSFYSKKLKEGLSSSYVIDMSVVLKQALEQAVTWKLTEENVAIKAKAPKLVRKKKEIWTKEEVEKFLNAAKNERMYHAFLLILFTGVRRGEALGLRWKDVDFENGLIHVKQAVKKNRNKKYYLGGTKTEGSERTIQISEKVVNELRELKKKRMKEYKVKESDLVITNTLNCMQDPRNLQRVKDRVVKREEMKNIRIHDMRHTHASLLLESGVSVKRVQLRLGHAKPSITHDIYSHVIPGDVDNTGDIFEELLNQ